MPTDNTKIYHLYHVPIIMKENHVINWSGAKILEREGHRKSRQVKESIWIRKETNCMERDGGAYSLLGGGGGGGGEGSECCNTISDATFLLIIVVKQFLFSYS